MVSRDGNGWVRCALGHRHWGRFGAAGLLAYVSGPDGAGQVVGGEIAEGEAAGSGTAGSGVLLQQRTWWSHHGGTWGLPGGARDSHESPLDAALREAAEECAVPPGAVVVRGIFVDDHGGWAYHTVLAEAVAPFEAYPASEETDDVTWVAADGVSALDLHPGFAARWDELREGLVPITVIVDAANVVGSRPNGWWRDRVGAARRLIEDVRRLADRGVAGLPVRDGFPVDEGLAAEPRLPVAGLPAPARWFPEFVVVLEGQARAAATSVPADGSDGSDGSDAADGAGGESARGVPGRLRVVSAPGSGDDAIAQLAGELPGRRLVVTADRELRSRCENVGAQVIGPRWLTDLMRS
jgi:8-oxo-dGTP diphosphatase